MSGARPTGFRHGDRAELLAEFCLSTLAFATRVPRQEDIGHDLFCVLAEVDGRLVQAGPFFTVQVKSNTKPLAFKRKHERDWLGHIENPFFLAVADVDGRRIDVYSTWTRLKGQLKKATRQIELIPGPPEQGQDDVQTAEDGSWQRIRLGNPVISATVDQLMNKPYAESLGHVLKQWIELDRENIVNCSTGVYRVLGPSPGSHRTNQELEPDYLTIYWNEKNRPGCQTNFVRAATDLRVTLALASGKTGKCTRNHANKVAALDAAIVAHWQCLDQVSQKALRDIGPPFSEQS